MGSYKVNTDGCAKDGFASGGGIIRDSLGQCIHAFFSSYGKCSILEVELRAIPDGIILAQRIVISDLWIESGGYEYFITFTDDYSRFGYIYLMTRKSEAFEKFKAYRTEVEKHLSKSIKTFRSDRGGEYLSGEFRDYLTENGIVSQLSAPGTPQQNDVSERRNRTLLDMVRSMMSFSTLPILFWGYALETAAYVLNLVPSKSIPKTPLELWNGCKPNLRHIRIWGCPAHVLKGKT
ncbi:Retrovirus-related Pol polyprotein from transposon TNT 1-94 [Abeliophyllum distichum]|uniref:Retrovirus-related Pol polyprotein from transposon TNT 1-94 n=1 Tax=Abeliophyllum distichum TaxID=126358 RepID=A0ABD1S945_9LAMI